MGMILRRQITDAHELAGADLDHRDARVVVEVRNDPVGHITFRPVASEFPSARAAAPMHCERLGGAGFAPDTARGTIATALTNG